MPRINIKNTVRANNIIKFGLSHRVTRVLDFKPRYTNNDKEITVSEEKQI